MRRAGAGDDPRAPLEALQNALEEGQRDGLGGHPRVDDPRVRVGDLTRLHHRRVRRRNVVERGQRVREEGLDSAPRVDHLPRPLEVLRVIAQRHVDHRRQGDRVIGAAPLVQRPHQPVESVDSARRAPRRREPRVHHHAGGDLDHLAARQPVGCPGSADRVDGGVGEQGIRVRVDYDQEAVAAHGLEADRTHQQPRQDAALDVQGVARQIDDVGGIDHVRMRDQRVAGRGQQAGHRGRVARVTADLRADAGRHDERRVEAGRVLHGAALQPEDRSTGSGPAAGHDPNLAPIAALVRLGDNEPHGRLVRPEGVQDGPREMVEKAAASVRRRDLQLAFNQIQRRPPPISPRSRRTRTSSSTSARPTCRVRIRTAG